MNCKPDAEGWDARYSHVELPLQHLETTCKNSAVESARTEYFSKKIYLQKIENFSLTKICGILAVGPRG